MILIEEQEVDDEGEVLVASEAGEPITLKTFDTLEEAEQYLSQIRSSVAS
jgi:hypothetical protein